MVDKFIEEFAKLIVDKPNAVRIAREDIESNFSEIIIYTDKSDVGKLIGKDGKMISSLKTVITGCKAKENRSFRVLVKANEEG